jgi:lambda repressor-like predicted transcriptional regulator
VIVLYLVLLVAGVSLFALSFVAQYRLATLLQQRYPQHWQIIAAADHARPSAWRR